MIELNPYRLQYLVYCNYIMLSTKNSITEFLFYKFMALNKNIQIFLQKKLKENNLERKDFAKKIKISDTAVTQLINAQRLNPNLSTLLKIANYFNCTIGEVIGTTDNHKEKQSYKFNDITLQEALLNLKNFIVKKLEEENLKKKKFTYKKLAIEMGFGEFTISNFIDNKTKNFNTEIIAAFTNRYIVSFDEIIGRISSQNQESQTLEKTE